MIAALIDRGRAGLLLIDGVSERIIVLRCIAEAVAEVMPAEPTESAQGGIADA